MWREWISSTLRYWGWGRALQHNRLHIVSYPRRSLYIDTMESMLHDVLRCHVIFTPGSSKRVCFDEIVLNLSCYPPSKYYFLATLQISDLPTKALGTRGRPFLIQLIMFALSGLTILALRPTFIRLTTVYRSVSQRFEPGINLMASWSPRRIPWSLCCCHILAPATRTLPSRQD